MLKTIEAVLAMLKEQEGAIVSEQIDRHQRDEAMIASIKQNSVEFQTQMEVMLGNVRLAIRKLEGTEAPHVQD